MNFTPTYYASNVPLAPTFIDFVQLLIHCQLVMLGAMLLGLLVLYFQTSPLWRNTPKVDLNKAGSFNCRLIAYIVGGGIAQWLYCIAPEGWLISPAGAVGITLVGFVSGCLIFYFRLFHGRK